MTHCHSCRGEVLEAEIRSQREVEVLVDVCYCGYCQREVWSKEEEGKGATRWQRDHATQRHEIGRSVDGDAL